MLARKIETTTEASHVGAKYDWIGSIPFFMVHFASIGVLFVSFSWWAVALCIGLLFVRIFAITGGYHRYFAHKTFKTSRFVQFLFGYIGNASAQLGPLWWAAHHRHHHRHSDEPEDVHSPVQGGFFWSHIGWVISGRFVKTRMELIQDFAKFPELVFINKHSWIAPVSLAFFTFGLGKGIEMIWPSWGITGWQFLFWGFFVSTTVLYHLTFAINSFTHIFGSRRFKTADDSRNNWIFGVLALGEGWHNNHHRFPQAARNGFYWWEIDTTYYVLKLMSFFGLVWNLQPVPEHIYLEAKKNKSS